MEFLGVVLLYTVGKVAQAKFSPSGHRIWFPDYEISMFIISEINMELGHIISPTFHSSEQHSLRTLQDLYVRKQPLRIDPLVLFSLMCSNRRYKN